MVEFHYDSSWIDCSFKRATAKPAVSHTGGHKPVGKQTEGDDYLARPGATLVSSTGGSEETDISDRTIVQLAGTEELSQSCCGRPTSIDY